jgi:hypothetical protein
VSEPAKPQILPVDTTAGGAAHIEKLKGFKKSKELSDISLLRVSPTIARQELLSYVRMLIRDCFQGQFADPFIHMDHAGDLTVPARFWVNRKGGMAKATISFTKARLMGQSIPELYPDLKRMMVYYWLFQEGKPCEDVPGLEDTPEFQQKLAYIESHADPRFVRVDYAAQSQDDKWAEKRTESQQLVDEYLRTLPDADLQLLFARNESLTSEERKRRGDLNDGVTRKHERAMKLLPSRLHYPVPPNQMIRRRAEEEFARRHEQPETE